MGTEFSWLRPPELPARHFAQFAASVDKIIRTTQELHPELRDEDSLRFTATHRLVAISGRNFKRELQIPQRVPPPSWLLPCFEGWREYFPMGYLHPDRTMLCAVLIALQEHFPEADIGVSDDAYPDLRRGAELYTRTHPGHLHLHNVILLRDTDRRYHRLDHGGRDDFL
jgi:hypothetical protein